MYALMRPNEMSGAKNAGARRQPARREIEFASQRARWDEERPKPNQLTLYLLAAYS